MAGKMTHYANRPLRDEHKSAGERDGIYSLVLIQKRLFLDDRRQLSAVGFSKTLKIIAD
jgi:hypothetical protein